MPHRFAVAYSVKSGTSSGGLGDGAGGGEGEDGGGEGEGGGGEGEGGEGGGIGQAVWQTYFCACQSGANGIVPQAAYKPPWTLVYFIKQCSLLAELPLLGRDGGRDGGGSGSGGGMG